MKDDPNLLPDIKDVFAKVDLEQTQATMSRSPNLSTEFGMVLGGGGFFAGLPDPFEPLSLPPEEGWLYRLASLMNLENRHARTKVFSPDPIPEDQQ